MLKRLITLLLVVILQACASSKPKEFTFKNGQKYNIVQVPYLVEKDTIMANELRFYKITSAKNTQQIIYDSFGKWNQQTRSKYGSRMMQLVWLDIPLLNDINQFTILADGTETHEDYFSAIMVLDKKFNDCLNSKHPLHEKIISTITKMMQNRSSSLNFYKLLKQ